MMKLSRASILNTIKKYYTKNSIRYNSEKTNIKHIVHLEQRSLLQLTGHDVSHFLQGLITNDIRHFEEGAVSIYSLLLNIKGRVLYDIIIYKTQEQGIFYVECDSSTINKLLKHFQMYKLKKKVDFKIMEHTMKVWTVFDTNVICQSYCDLEKNFKLEGKIFPCGINDNKSSKIVDDILIYNDPRIFELGLRILTPSDITFNDIVKNLEPNISIEKNISNYRAFRYKLGIGEGVKDFSFGVSFPLEINCDYLHGVSFHKGCYIGQELTTRTHHTGIVRKRLMPLIFNSVDNVQLEYDDKIINDDGKVVGKLKGQEGKFGLGLIRISEALASKELFVKDYVLKIIKPQWWPQESQKVEILKSNKN